MCLTGEAVVADAAALRNESAAVNATDSTNLAANSSGNSSEANGSSAGAAAQPVTAGSASGSVSSSAGLGDDEFPAEGLVFTVTDDGTPLPGSPRSSQHQSIFRTLTNRSMPLLVSSSRRACC